MGESVKNYLSLLELDVRETHGLFNLLDTGHGMVSLEEFVKGIVRLKGHSHSQDVIAIMHQNDRIFDLVQQIEQQQHPQQQQDKQEQVARPAGQASEPALIQPPDSKGV